MYPFRRWSAFVSLNAAAGTSRHARRSRCEHRKAQSTWEDRTMARRASVSSLAAFAVLAALVLRPAVGADAVKITVGYQPYDTISYSAVVIRGLELWKKHLPKGTEVEFESALQGAIIVNAM